MATTDELKDLLARERQEIRSLHEGGALGGQVCSAFIDLYDRILAVALEAALAPLSPSDRRRAGRELSLVAVGGYGRGDPALGSDVDLLFLVAPRAHPVVEQVTGALVRSLWDAGLKLSQSVRTPGNCLSFCRQDFALRTSLAEARYVAGDTDLFGDLRGRFLRYLSGVPADRFIALALEERVKEHQDYFVATAKLLEPNVKKSPGGLRDLHLIRWVALAKYGTRDPEMLRAAGALGSEDARFIMETGDFLLRIRHDLHFHAGTAQDVLTRDEQVRVAKLLGFENEGHLLGVERFMQQYHRQTMALHDLTRRFLAAAGEGSLLRRVVTRFFTRRVEQHYLASPVEVSIDPDTPDEVLGQAEVLLRLFDLARETGKRISHPSLERVRAAVPACVLTPESRARFLRMMSVPLRLGGMVRELHRVGLLGRFIPAFEHARCLMQFNQLHKFTVDEHSIRALDEAVARVDDPGPLGDVYREVRRKDVLHLAVLLHDIGKGYEGDHSEVGKRLAGELAETLGLGENERDLLVFLVHKHLLMAHTAFRRDISDADTLVRFVRAVGTPEALKMLTILTAADTEATSPGSFTAWKASLLMHLYARAAEELAGDRPVEDEEDRGETVRRSVRDRLKDRFPGEDLDRHLRSMPEAYLRRVPPEVVAGHLRGRRAIEHHGVHVDSEYLAETGLTQYTVYARGDLTTGIFAKITGALAAERFRIVDAWIVTAGDGLVVDSFRGEDADYAGEPPLDRRVSVARQIEAVLLGTKSVEDLLAASEVAGAGNGTSSGEPTRVEIDNATSDHYTIVEIFTDDRPGLLFQIARLLRDLGLSVATAKIATRLDQVVDVFYVHDRETRRKVEDEARLEAVRTRLLGELAVPVSR